MSSVWDGSSYWQMPRRASPERASKNVDKKLITSYIRIIRLPQTSSHLAAWTPLEPPCLAHFLVAWGLLKHFSGLLCQLPESDTKSNKWQMHMWMLAHKHTTRVPMLTAWSLVAHRLMNVSALAPEHSLLLTGTVSEHFPPHVRNLTKPILRSEQIIVRLS